VGLFNTNNAKLFHHDPVGKVKSKDRKEYYANEAVGKVLELLNLK